MTGRDKFSKIYPILKIIGLIISIFPSSFIKACFSMSRSARGYFGIIIRYIILSRIADIGKNVVIMENVYIHHPENLKIGDNVSIHPMCYIEASGGIEIGNDVSLAHATTILSESHTYGDSDKPIKYHPLVFKKVIIKDNVWVGCKVTILCGLVINSNCIIGANSVLTKDTIANAIYAGCPAKIIKMIS